MRKLLSVVAAGSLLAGCADAGAPIDRGFEGPGVEITMAALNLQGVGDVVWDLQVVNGADPAQSVWQQRISSSQYGDSAGSASYVGPCDADPATGVASNTVKVWVVGVYNQDVPTADVGVFASGSASAIPVTWTDGDLANGEAVPFQNPTTAATPLSRTFTCLENQDVFVQFDVALMRPAQQGFFDIAVNFNSIFCSAKFDCAYETAATAGSGACVSGGCVNASGFYDPDQPVGANSCTADTDCVTRSNINLLHTATSGRGKTFILGFACTAGADTVATGTGDKSTKLYLDNLKLTCDSGADVFYVNTKVGTGGNDGNLCNAGFTTCTNIWSDETTKAASAVANTYLYQAAVYSGVELLEAGAGLSYNKGYWNVALGVTADATAAGAQCILSANGTAENGAVATDNVADGHIANGSVYPYIVWNVDFGTCAAEPLTFGVSGAMVSTSYTTTTKVDRGSAATPGGPTTDSTIDNSDLNGAGGTGYDDFYFDNVSPSND